jgi:hypothetical protein
LSDPREIEVLALVMMGTGSVAEASRLLGRSQAEISARIHQLAPSGAALVPGAIDLHAMRVSLVDVGKADFREPFYLQTLETATQEHALRVDVAIDVFAAAAARHRSPPAGFIFHVGRCGSTLLANMLSASDEYGLLKEPDPLNDLLVGWLHARSDFARGLAEEWTRSLVCYLIDKLQNRRYRLIKTAAWNVMAAEALFRLFPETPAIFVVRPPLETVASLVSQRPGWMEFGVLAREHQARVFPTLAAVPSDVSLTDAELFAHGWSSMVAAALALPPERFLILTYAELVEQSAAVLDRVLHHLGHSPPPETRERMLAARKIYSKDPANRARFDPQGALRRSPLDPISASRTVAIASDAERRLAARLAQRPSLK